MRQDPGLLSSSQQIQEIARKVPDPLSMKAGSGNETSTAAAGVGGAECGVHYFEFAEPL